MLRKIALSSMKGRKKDTIILSSVIILSFIFIVITTVFHASSEKTKYEQKSAMYGKWDLAYYNGDLDTQNSLLVLEDVEKLGVSRIIGKSPSCGVLGTINQDLIDLGSFKMYEGRMPESDDEIALELNQLKHFPSDIKIGDTIPVRIDISISERTNNEVSNDHTYKIVSMLEVVAKEIGMREPYDLEKLYKGHASEYVRNTQSLEAFNGTTIVVRTSHLYTNINLNLEEAEDNIRALFEGVKSFNTLKSQKAHITRDMVVSGIFQTYSNLWDKSYYQVANAFITENTAEYLMEKGYFLSKEVNTSRYKTPYNFFIGTKSEAKDFYDKYNTDLSGLRVNTYLYSDEEQSTENTLVYGILLSAFIATIFTVFLIYFTQMKRRTRRIALLKSIGATNAQIWKLLFWEVSYLLTRTIPVGVLGGISIGKIILLITNKHGKTDLIFYIDWKLIVLGVIVGVLAIFISMLVPMIMSIKIPLTGTISEPPKRKKTFFRVKKDKTKSKELDFNNEPKKIKGKIKQANLDMKIQSFGRISFKNIRYNRGKHFLTAGLYTATITVLLGCVFLSYLFFGDYINKVIVKGKPSFGYEIKHGMSKREILDMKDELYSIKGVTNVDIFKGGEHVYLWYNRIEDNRLYQAYKKIVPNRVVADHFGINNVDYVNLDEDNIHLVKDAIVTNIYGIDVDASIFQEFNNVITKGRINKEKFEAGEEVIILMPIYDKIDGYYVRTDLDKEKEAMKLLKANKKSFLKIDYDEELQILQGTDEKNRMKTFLQYKNVGDISYDFRKSKYYFHDNSIKIEEKIYLTIPTENYANLIKTNDVAFNEVDVAALIYFFPEKGIWPFSDTVENPVIVGSYNFTEKLYPLTVMSHRGINTATFNSKISALTPTKYGKSWIFIENDNKLFNSKSQISIQRIAKENNFKLHEYKESNDIIYKNHRNNYFRNYQHYTL